LMASTTFFCSSSLLFIMKNLVWDWIQSVTCTQGFKWPSVLKKMILLLNYEFSSSFWNATSFLT
jgi:hypothetical protein